MIKVEVRLAYEGDVPFIFDAWMKTMRCVPPYKAVRPQVFNKAAKAKIQGLIDRSSVYVLCNPDDASQLYSFIVFERKGDLPIIHFAYTKSLFWRLGLMKTLIKTVCPDALSGCVFTCFTPSLSSEEWFVSERPFIAHLESKYGMIFNPFLEQQT